MLDGWKEEIPSLKKNSHPPLEKKKKKEIIKKKVGGWEKSFSAQVCFSTRLLAPSEIRGVKKKKKRETLQSIS